MFDLPWPATIVSYPGLMLISYFPLSEKIIFLISGLFCENLTPMLTVIYVLSICFPFVIYLASYFVNFSISKF